MAHCKKCDEYFEWGENAVFYGFGQDCYDCGHDNTPTSDERLMKLFGYVSDLLDRVEKLERD